MLMSMSWKARSVWSQWQFGCRLSCQARAGSQQEGGCRADGHETEGCGLKGSFHGILLSSLTHGLEMGVG